MTFEQKALELSKCEYEYFNDENFYCNSNEERFNKYIDNYLLKYVTKKEDILTHIVEFNESTLWTHNGIKVINNELYATIPKRKTLIDEMNGIYTITKLINKYKNNNIFDRNITDDVISHFNIFEYLKQYSNESFAMLYINSLKADSINMSKNQYLDVKQDIAKTIYAYLMLEKYFRSYNIDKLNKINAKSKSLKKSLKENGYTL